LQSHDCKDAFIIRPNVNKGLIFTNSFIFRLNAVSQVDDSVDQAMSQATIFPTGAAPPKDPKKPHLGYATEKSSNGEITYYASVGSNGRVSFTPARQVKVNSAEDSTSS
jgi:hypothetical protein